MTAIRIIDDHLELANIGSNTHAQIDTHIAAAGDYVKRDGSLALTADWDIGDTRKILADEIRARDGAGLKLYDDGSNGIFVKDGGNVGIGTGTPLQTLHIVGYYGAVGQPSPNTASQIVLENNLNCGFSILSKNTSKGLVMFGDAQDNYSGGIEYDHSVDKLIFQVNNVDHLVVDSSGDAGIGTTTPTAKLDINSDIFRVRTAKTPASAGAAGNTGDRAWDADYFYICVATNTWERTAHATWV